MCHSFMLYEKIPAVQFGYFFPADPGPADRVRYVRAFSFGSQRVVRLLVFLLGHLSWSAASAGGGLLSFSPLDEVIFWASCCVTRTSNTSDTQRRRAFR